MKVLLPIIWHELTHCIARAFEEEGHEVRVVDWRKDMKLRHLGRLEQGVIQAAKEFRPDLAFCQFQMAGAVSKHFLFALKKMSCFSVNWSGDVRDPLPVWYRDLAQHFDVTSFSNGTDVDIIRKDGKRAEFLQIGYEERIYYAGDEERSGVVFLGNNYGARYPEGGHRKDMVVAMADAFPDRFKVYGVGWAGIVPEQNVGGYVAEPGDAAILRRALVAVGWDHFHRPGFASDRLTRATACGCEVVNQWYEGIHEEHPFVHHVKSVDDMVMATYSILNDPERWIFGPDNARNTLENHRWNNRVQTITSWMG